MWKRPQLSDSTCNDSRITLRIRGKLTNWPGHVLILQGTCCTDYRDIWWSHSARIIRVRQKFNFDSTNHHMPTLQFLSWVGLGQYLKRPGLVRITSHRTKTRILYTPDITSCSTGFSYRGGGVISHKSIQGLVMEGEDRTRVLQLGFHPNIARSVPSTDQTSIARWLRHFPLQQKV